MSRALRRIFIFGVRATTGHSLVFEPNEYPLRIWEYEDAERHLLRHLCTQFRRKHQQRPSLRPADGRP